ncbi:gala protein [Planotetraspora kaengkrachanensis]|uniref:Gala protein n=1 Tax=Planotetraspora kaengkrachanensis TaxID=575193 RepID=A0A8J3PX78_9ACTN|nr:gala protein [Planotetraspora kaengkrachanensis]GIG82733.1 hypothetical protein Pka01_58600 [Planotetraspora kaengkrachanensis]
MTQPTPVRCPAIEHPDVPLTDPETLGPLLARLAATDPVEADETFPVGTVRQDGRVDLCKQGLGLAGAARLLPVATASPHAVHLLLGTNAIGSEGARMIAGALVPGHGLRTLYLGCNRIDADGAAALADRLADDDTVRALWLKRNPIGDAGVRALAAMMRRNTSLRTLDLVNTGLTAEGLGALLHALTVRPRPIERLYLGGNGLDTAAAPLLAALIRDAGVRELYLPANHLGDEGAAILGGIETLDLGRPPSERTLGASPNATGDAGAQALGEALAGSPLRRLELRHTGVTGRGAKTLLSGIVAGTRLEHLGLGPGVPRKVKRSIAPLLRPAEPSHPDVAAIGSVYR